MVNNLIFSEVYAEIPIEEINKKECFVYWKIVHKTLIKNENCRNIYDLVLRDNDYNYYELTVQVNKQSYRDLSGTIAKEINCSWQHSELGVDFEPRIWNEYGFVVKDLHNNYYNFAYKILFDRDSNYENIQTCNFNIIDKPEIKSNEVIWNKIENCNLFIFWILIWIIICTVIIFVFKKLKNKSKNILHFNL